MDQVRWRPTCRWSNSTGIIATRIRRLQPFWLKTRSGPLLSVPYSLEVNDSPAIVFRQHGASEYERMMIDQFDEMLLQSKKWPLVCTLVIHPFIIGYPFRLRALRRARSSTSPSSGMRFG